MDAAFEILLPIEDEIPSFQFQQPEYEWQGVKYPQGPPESSFYSFRLLKSSIPTYIVSMLPSHCQTIDWQCISILGDGLKFVRDSLLIVGEDNSERLLFDLLNALLSNRSRWVVVFEPDYNGIDEIKEGEIEEVFEKVKSSLIEKRGFIMWHYKSLSENLGKRL